MKRLTILVLFEAALFSSMQVNAIEPSGGSLTVVSSYAPSSGNASNHAAIAGNITEINLVGANSGFQTWQAYYCNVTCGLKMGDSTGSVLYNWTVSSPSGEVYASTNASITWANIQCLNFSANGTYTDETGNGGTTNQAGANVTTLEN